MKKVMIFIMGIFIFTSCSDKKELIGDWDDNIKLSRKNAIFSCEVDSISIDTQGNGWWIDSVEDSDDRIYFPEIPYDLLF